MDSRGTRGVLSGQLSDGLMSQSNFQVVFAMDRSSTATKSWLSHPELHERDWEAHHFSPRTFNSAWKYYEVRYSELSSITWNNHKQGLSIPIHLCDHATHSL
jgi:hypothetical protein